MALLESYGGFQNNLADIPGDSASSHTRPMVGRAVPGEPHGTRDRFARRARPTSPGIQIKSMESCHEHQ